MVSRSQRYDHESRGNRLRFFPYTSADGDNELLGESHQLSEYDGSKLEHRDGHRSATGRHHDTSRLDFDQQRADHDFIGSRHWRCAIDLSMVSRCQRCDNDTRGNKLGVLHNTGFKRHNELLGEGHQYREYYRCIFHESHGHRGTSCDTV